MNNSDVEYIEVEDGNGCVLLAAVEAPEAPAQQTRPGNHRARWTLSELEELRQMIEQGAAPRDIGRALGRSEKAVVSRAAGRGWSAQYPGMEVVSMAVPK